ncbi:MAG TPA: CBS domain-containing protein [Rhodanobacteraceae bacterium]|jgi:CBS domain-containing protein|nr:CBS domain-containing protein [Rhodanobacteraceae bacterium]HEX5488606.1 CBS domain-containing protein [Rhodanobacteraceae bacterium]
MRQVKHLLEGKGNAVYTITPEAPVLDAIRLMAERSVGALPVMRGEALAGIVTERDYARKVILKGHSSRETPVSDIMTPAPTSVAPVTTVDECMRLCTELRVRHLPVLENNKLVGIVSIGDLVKAVIDDQAAEIDHLQRYIAG